MIIHFDNVNLASNSGPNSFAQRLHKSLTDEGHTVIIEDGKCADISLVFIEPSGRQLSKVIVQRLDGIWFAPHEFESKNKSIKNLYTQCNHVVWQSNFDKRMTENWWGSRAGSVIKNGIEVTEQNNLDLQKQIESLKSKHEKIFVCSANWHPQKRLKENLELFRLLKKSYPTACLIVMGSNANITEESVYVTGSLPHSYCLQIFRNCDWMLHLAWLDHCPNTVIEAISCGLPVICSEHGGTKEIVQNYGVVLKENQPYQFELADYNSPPKLDVSQLITLPQRLDLGSPPNVSIKTSCRHYLKVFDSLLKK